MLFQPKLLSCGLNYLLLSFIWYLVDAAHCAGAHTVTQVYQFPNSPFTDIENIAIRSNGDLLLNVITSAATYILDPTQLKPQPTLLHSYPDANSTIGIVETTPDVFVVAVGNYSIATFSGIKGSFAVWKIDLTSGAPGTLTKIVSIPEAESFNGATIAPDGTDIVLIADSALGGVWSVDINTGQYTMAIQNNDLTPSSGFPLGVNGIHTRGSTLYFTNSAQGTYGSIPITNQGTADGIVRIISHPLTSSDIYDDFTFDSTGNAYVTTHPNSIVKIHPSGKESLFAGNNSAFDQPTSAAFGRGSSEQECLLYVVSAGTRTTPVSGQIISVNTC